MKRSHFLRVREEKGHKAARLSPGVMTAGKGPTPAAVRPGPGESQKRDPRKHGQPGSREAAAARRAPVVHFGRMERAGILTRSLLGGVVR